MITVPQFISGPYEYEDDLGAGKSVCAAANATVPVESQSGTPLGETSMFYYILLVDQHLSGHYCAGGVGGLWRVFVAPILSDIAD